MSKVESYKKNKPSFGLALGGGGPLGGIYEIGALRALNEALEGLDFNDLDVYVGVNSGSFVAANLANQITPAQMCRIFVRNEKDVHPFHPSVFYKPAFSEYAKRCKAIPKILFKAWLNFISHPNDQSVLASLTSLAQAIPSGIFDNEGFHQYVSRSYNVIGRTNNFNALRKNLTVIATDLESGDTICFGDPEYLDVPISKAIQSSMASPGLYKSVNIDGRHYVDGTLNKGLHASVAIDKGADIVFAINPVVPIDAVKAIRTGTMEKGDLVDSGMPSVLAQTYRTMVHSRLSSGLRHVKKEYPGKEVLLFEPSSSDADIFFSSVFSFKARKDMCERAYQITRMNLRERADELSRLLAPSGIRIRHDILNDEHRTLSTGLYGEALPMYQGNVKHFSVAKGDVSTSSYLEKMTQRVASIF